MKPTLVTCYVSPDLDGVAGAFAYAEFLGKTGVDAVAGIIGEMHDEATYVFSRFNITRPMSLPNADAYDRVALVDASELVGLYGKIDPNTVIEIIDHRLVNEANKFPNAKAHIEPVGAAATLVAERYISKGISISRESAILLIGGIISNTFNFKGSVTTDRDKKAFEWLNRVAGLPDDFWEELFMAKSNLVGNKLKERMEEEFTWFHINNFKVGIAQIEIIGAKPLLNGRTPEILAQLQKMQRDRELDYIFLNTVELKACINYFVTDDVPTKKLLEKTLGVHFSGTTAARNNLIMRKQIVPLLKLQLDKKPT